MNDNGCGSDVNGGGGEAAGSSDTASPVGMTASSPVGAHGPDDVAGPSTSAQDANGSMSPEAAVNGVDGAGEVSAPATALTGADLTAHPLDAQQAPHEATTVGFRGLSDRDLATLDAHDRIEAKAPEAAGLVGPTDHVLGTESSYVSLSLEREVAERYAKDVVAVVETSRAIDVSSGTALDDDAANLNALRDQEVLSLESPTVVATYSKHGANGIVNAKGEVVHDLSLYGTELADGRVQYDFSPELTQETLPGPDGEERVVERQTGRSVVRGDPYEEDLDSTLEGRLY